MFESDGESLIDEDAEDTFKDENEDEIDFYAILNVSREATDEEIHRAYKQRSLVFHPDRHLDEQDKKEAAKLFVDLRQAYETLTNPQLRKVYNVLGARGIKMQGWQLVDRSATPENIRREYEFLSRMHEAEVMLQRVHPTSNFMGKISLIGCFQEKHYKYGPELTAMNMGQSVDCALFDSHRAGLGGHINFNEKGMGNGLVRASHNWTPNRSIFHETWLEARPELLGIGSKLVLSNTSPNSAFYQYSLLLQPSLQYSTRNFTLMPSFIAMLATPQKLNWQGTIAFEPMHAVTISLNYLRLNRPKLKAIFQLSAIEPFYNLRLIHHHHHWGDSHWTLQCNLNLNQITPSLSYECRLTRYSRMALKIQCSYPACLLQGSLKIRTSLSSYEFWFIFCDNQEDMARAFIQGVFLPFLALNTARLVCRRLSIYKRFMGIFEDRKDEELLNQSRKDEAERVVHLMRESAERVMREEQQKKGLVIVEAQYGQMLADVAGAERYPVTGEKIIDVTIPLQTLVNDSQLRLYSGKSQTPGFYDPCPGQLKCLRVLYRFHDRLHAVTIAEDQPLQLPLRAHRIQQDSATDH